MMRGETKRARGQQDLLEGCSDPSRGFCFMQWEGPREPGKAGNPATSPELPRFLSSFAPLSCLISKLFLGLSFLPVD